MVTWDIKYQHCYLLPIQFIKVFAHSLQNLTEALYFLPEFGIK